MHEVSELWVYIESADAILLGCKIGSIYVKMIGFIVETPDRIKLGVNKITDLCYLIGSYERSRYGNLDDSFYGISLVI